MWYKEGTFHEMAAKNIYFAPLIIALAGAIASISPDWFTPFGIIGGIILLLSIIWFIVGRIFKLHLHVRWHAGTMIFTFNYLGVCCLIPFWRLVGEPLWLLILLASLYIICFYLTIKYKHTVAKGIYSKNRRNTLFGKIYWTSTYILIALSGGGSYPATRALQNQLGYDGTLMFIAIAILPLSFITIIAIQGLWTRIEDPAYDFNEN